MLFRDYNKISIKINCIYNMQQKVLRVGSSAAVTIPKRSLEDLGLKVGDEVNVHVDSTAKTVLVRPVSALAAEDVEIARLGLRFIQRYRKDIEALARK